MKQLTDKVTFPNGATLSSRLIQPPMLTNSGDHGLLPKTPATTMAPGQTVRISPGSFYFAQILKKTLHRSTRSVRCQRWQNASFRFYQQEIIFSHQYVLDGPAETCGHPNFFTL